MPELDAIADTDEPENEDLEAVLSTVAAEGEGAILVQISKIEKGRAAWIFNAHPVDMPNLMERIRDEYGSGDYEAVIRRGNRIARRKRFSLLVPQKIARHEEPKQSHTNDVALVLAEIMNRGFQELGKLIVDSRVAPPTPPPIDPYAQMQQMLSMMATMKQVFDSGAPKVDPTAQFLKGIEFAKEIAGDTLGEKSDPTPGQVLANLAEKMVPVLTNLTAPKPPQTPRPKIQVKTSVPPNKPLPYRVQKPTTIPTPPPAPINGGMINQTKKELGNMNIMKIALQRPIRNLCNVASQGATPEQCAPEVLNQVPDQFFGAFCEFIEAPDAIDRMVEIEGNVGNMREWFNNLRSEILRLLTEDDAANNIEGIDATGHGEIDPHHHQTFDDS